MRARDAAIDSTGKRSAFMRLALSFAAILLTLDHAWGAEIGERAISELREALSRVEEARSTVDTRRACKRVIRKGLSLVKECPEAPNRFAVLGVVLEGQQKLLEVDDSERNRKAMFDTCRALAQAPDEQAEARLPADILLTQVAMGRGESPEEMAEPIAELVSRYEGTPAEAECLMVATMMARSGGSAELLKTFRATLTERFPEVPRVKAFLRERFGTTDRMFIFRGDFTRADGTVLRLPVDRLGRPFLACFWSETVDYLDERLLKIRAVQERYPDRFDVLSFNLDELQDSGQGTLRRLGLDWTPMKLPGGVESDAYLEYAYFGATPFSFVAVNEMGYVKGKSNRSSMPSAEQDVASVLSSREIGIRDPSYFALMRSLLVGDFLVNDGTDIAAKTDGPSVPEGELRAIRACFPPAPARCRLKRADALANYRKADELCRSAIESHPGASDLYLARNRRIVALMGMWKLTGDAGHLERAVKEAKTAHAEDAPAAARVVPNFCIARHAIREGAGSVMEQAENAEAAVAAFIEACGGERAPGAAHAAAVVLALDAGHRNLYLNQRDIIMARFDEDRRTWPVAWFFLGRASAAELFDADGIYGVSTRSAWNIRNVPFRMFRAEFTTLSGKEVAFPADTEDKHNIVVFVDPTVEGEMGKLQQEYLAGLHHAVGDHRHKEMKLVLVFLSGDRALAESIVKRNRWNCEAALLEGGVDDPAAVRLGAFAPDRLPKTYVVAPEGRIEGTHDGLLVVRDYYGKLNARRERSRTLEILQSVKRIIREYDARLGKEAMAREDYEEAAKRLAVSFPGRPVGRNRYVRECVQANMALKNWEVALTSSNEACREGKMGRPYFLVEFAADLDIRAAILRRLGRKTEAERDRKRASELYKKAADVWEARAADMEKNGQKDRAQRWWVEAKRARAKQ